jgi:cytochrome bd ubiquinol oxidase subunit II
VRSRLPSAAVLSPRGWPPARWPSRGCSSCATPGSTSPAAPPPWRCFASSGAVGLITLALCWRSRFSLARLTAALAVAAVVVGWAAAQAPRFLPGMTVTQAAAGRSTLVALIIGVACGSVILIPSLALLFTIFLRGHLDTPEHHAPASPEAAPAEATSFFPGAAPSTAASSAEAAFPGAAAAAGSPPRGARLWGGASVAGLVAGAGLLVFANPAWAHGLGVACLILCAVAVFHLLSAPPAS